MRVQSNARAAANLTTPIRLPRPGRAAPQYHRRCCVTLGPAEYRAIDEILAAGRANADEMLQTTGYPNRSRGNVSLRPGAFLLQANSSRSRRFHTLSHRQDRIRRRFRE